MTAAETSMKLKLFLSGIRQQILCLLCGGKKINKKNKKIKIHHCLNAETVPSIVYNSSSKE